MKANEKTSSKSLSADEVARRRRAVEKAEASIVMEGGRVDDEMKERLNSWAEGDRTEEDIVAELKETYARKP